MITVAFDGANSSKLMKRAESKKTSTTSSDIETEVAACVYCKARLPKANYNVQRLRLYRALGVVALRRVQSKRACTTFRPQLIDGAFQGIPQKVTRFLRLWSKVRQHAVQQDGLRDALGIVRAFCGSDEQPGNKCGYRGDLAHPHLYDIFRLCTRMMLRQSSRPAAPLSPASFVLPRTVPIPTRLARGCLPILPAPATGVHSSGGF